MLAAILVILFTYFLVALFRRRDEILQFWRVRSICIREFEKVNGPPAVPIFGTLWYFKKDPVEMIRQAQQWFTEHTLAANSNGLMKVWMGPVPSVSICRGEVAKMIFDSSTNITKSSQYEKLKEWIGDGLLISTGAKWRSRRKMLTQTFHFAVLKDYHKVFAAQGKVLVDCLQLRANNTYPFDIMPYIKRCTLDIICETAMGSSISSQRGSNDEYVESVRRLSELIWNYEKAPLFWIKPIWYLFGEGFEFERHVKLTTDFTREVIEKRKEELRNQESFETPDKKLAFLDYLLKSQEEHPEILTDEGIREEVDTFMFEGHDTTSSGITFAVWFLGQYPEYQQRVQDELDEIFGDDFERHPNSEDIQKMVFLEQCIKETLRILPPVPFVSRKLEEDVMIPHPTKPPVLLPAGMTIMINIITIMKDARYFEKPYEFFPEHFCQERVNGREAFAYVPFSAGPRNCIGQKFALLEEKVVLSWIFRNFTVTSLTKYPEEIPIPELILKPQFGTQVLLKNRRKY